MKETREEIEIDLRQMLRAIWSNVWIVIIVAALFAAIAFGYSRFFLKPTYSANVKLYVNNTYGENSPGFSSSQLTAAQSLVETYMVILESRNVLNEVGKQIDLGYSYEELVRMISAKAVNETEVFQVTVTNTNYRHAAIIANAIADVLPDKIAAVAEGSSVRIVDYAVENPEPVGPNHMKYMLMGGMIGAFITLAIILLLEIQNTTIYSEEYLAQVYNELPLLTVIPGVESNKSAYYKGYYEAQKKKPAEKKTGGSKV